MKKKTQPKSMEYVKTVLREFYSNTSLLQEIRKLSNSLDIYLKNRKRTNKPKVSRKK